MCGIAGLLGVGHELAQLAAPRMLAAMRHRGPDGHAIEAIPPISAARSADAGPVLLHARLAILDLSPAGRQPMADRPHESSGRPNWIVFNGEVFNYLNLHPALNRAGWPCRTRCDTETVLHAYRVWGQRSVERMEGMFAWCLLDTAQGTAWFCRDRLGIKPLYMVRPPSGGLLFASEIRTLLAAGPKLVRPLVKPAALESFLAQGAVCGAESIIDGVRLLAPGESLTTDWSGRPLRTRQYWQIPFRPPGVEPTSCLDAGARNRVAAEVGQSLRGAVSSWLASDVPLGLFLSGGVDSASLAAVATEVAGSDVRTVSIGFDQPEFDETEAAASVASALGTAHQTLRLSGDDVLEDLPAVLAAIDQPTVDGFNTFFVSRAARRAGLTVALSGVGGDELFGGYASFRDVPRALRMKRVLHGLGPAGPVATRLLGRRRRGFVKLAELVTRPASVLPLYLLRRELFLPAERRQLQGLPEGVHNACGVPQSLYNELEQQLHKLDAANQVSLLELSLYMRNMLLRDADVFSMAHGLELRTPLLDHRLVERVAALPGNWKLPQHIGGVATPVSKWLLVEAVGARLPRQVYTSKKRGFTFPWAAWLRGPVRERAARALRDADTWEAIGIHPAAPRNMWGRFLRGDARVVALQVLALVVLQDFAYRHGLKVAA